MTTSALDEKRTDGESEQRPRPTASRPGKPFHLAAGDHRCAGSARRLGHHDRQVQAARRIRELHPGCSLNPVVSCGNIMKSEQAAAFGFPNPMLGLVAYGSSSASA